MTLLQLSNKIRAICEPYITEADRNHYLNGKDPVKVVVGANIDTTHNVSTYKYTTQFFIGGRHFHYLKDASTPQELIKQVKLLLKPTPIIGKDIKIHPHEKLKTRTN